MAMSKSEFDAYRQSIYNRAQLIYNQYNGTSVVADKNRLLGEMDALLAGFKQTYEATRCTAGQVRLLTGCIEPEWIDSRYHDYYDFWLKIADNWRAELSATGTVAPTGTTTTTTGSQCLAGICGPSSPLQAVSTGSAGSGGVVSTAVSGGGVTLAAPTLPLGSGLSPSPFNSDLPGVVSIPLSQVSPVSGAGEGVSMGVQEAGLLPSFDFKAFVKSPFGMVLLVISGLILLMRVPAAKGA